MKGLRSDEFSLLLLNQPRIRSRTLYSNLVLSPVSIHVVLALMAAGSSGSTRDLILRCLDSDLLNSDVLNLLSVSDLFVASGVWIDQTLTLKASFKNIADYMGACNHHLDFKNKEEVKAREELNSWAGMKTNGLIEEMLPPGLVNSLNRLILTSAICFKADWEEPFAASTRLEEFYPSYRKPRKVPFMTDIPHNRRYVGAFDGFKVLRLPYKQGDNERVMFSMYFFLPDANNGLNLLIDKLNSDPGFIDRHVPHKKVEVGSLMIPKFEIRFDDFASHKARREHGLVLPLSSGHLSEMVENGDDDDRELSIVHKAFIQVDHQGTEAAAVSMGLSCGMNPPKSEKSQSSILHQVEEKVTEAAANPPKKVRKEKSISFEANHPFMFVVREDISGMVIFTGKVHILED